MNIIFFTFEPEVYSYSKNIQKDKTKIVKLLVKRFDIPELTVMPYATSYDIFWKYSVEAKTKLVIAISRRIEPKLNFNK